MQCKVAKFNEKNQTGQMLNLTRHVFQGLPNNYEFCCCSCKMITATSLTTPLDDGKAGTREVHGTSWGHYSRFSYGQKYRHRVHCMLQVDFTIALDYDGSWSGKGGGHCLEAYTPS